MSDYGYIRVDFHGQFVSASGASDTIHRFVYPVPKSNVDVPSNWWLDPITDPRNEIRLFNGAESCYKLLINGYGTYYSLITRNRRDARGGMVLITVMVEKGYRIDGKQMVELLDMLKTEMLDADQWGNDIVERCLDAFGFVPSQTAADIVSRLPSAGVSPPQAIRFYSTPEEMADFFSFPEQNAYRSYPGGILFALKQYELQQAVVPIITSPLQRMFRIVKPKNCLVTGASSSLVIEGTKLRIVFGKDKFVSKPVIVVVGSDDDLLRYQGGYMIVTENERVMYYMPLVVKVMQNGRVLPPLQVNVSGSIGAQPIDFEVDTSQNAFVGTLFERDLAANSAAKIVLHVSSNSIDPVEEEFDMSQLGQPFIINVSNRQQQSPASQPLAVQSLDFEQQTVPLPTMSCPYCGNEVYTTAKRCHYCGKWLQFANDDDPNPPSVAFATPGQPVPMVPLSPGTPPIEGHEEAITLPSPLVACPECGQMISRNAPSCPKCGYPIAKTIACPECGLLISIMAKSCPRCGFPMKNGTAGNTSGGKKTNGAIYLTTTVTLLLLAIASGIYLLANKSNAQEAADIDDEQVEEMVQTSSPDIAVTDIHEPQPEDVQNTVKATEQNTVKTTEQNIVEDSKFDNEKEVVNQDERKEDDRSAGAQDVKDGTDNKRVKTIDDVGSVPKKYDPDKIFTAVEHMPTFPGGAAALLRFISSHLQYPQAAADNNVQGKVYVKFVVTSTGRVEKVQIARSVDKALDQEALRVCRMLPNFTPGRQDGQPVNVWYTLPITFKLNN